MKILVDGNIPSITVDELRSLNHDVKDIRGTELEGSDDDILFDLALVENRLIITTDRGFAKIYDTKHGGIIIITLKKPNEKGIHDKIMNVIKRNSDEYFTSKIIIIKDKVMSVRTTHFDV